MKRWSTRMESPTCEFQYGPGSVQELQQKRQSVLVYVGNKAMETMSEPSSAGGRAGLMEAVWSHVAGQ